MIDIDLKSLIAKMNPALRASLEGAAGLCMARSHYNVEIEHWLLKLIDTPNTDFSELLYRFEINPAQMEQQLNRFLEGLRQGNSRAPALSPAIVELCQNAWMLASVDYGHGAVTSGHLLTALLLNESQRREILDSCPELAKIPPEALREAARAVIGETGESSTLLKEAAPRDSSAAPAGAPSQSPALDRFTINLTERAKAGQIDPVLGRDEEIRQCVDILTRRRQNNPILTGEAGVGKTAVVEGLALRVANDDIPEPLRNVQIRSLDLGLLQAGASVKGEFENRLKQVIEEVKASPQPIILFIDEAHTLIGAGGKEGQNDAANLLKPALARGELRTIAATTWAEYKKYFERDPALTRRFQVVKVEEPDFERAVDMMRGICHGLQLHHRVRILDEAIVASVRLSSRYIPGRQLPDKSVSLLDTACARVALSQSATPAPIEDSRRRIQQLEQTIAALEREQAISGSHGERLAQLNQELTDCRQLLASQEAQWAREKELVAQIQSITDRIDQDFLSQRQGSTESTVEALSDAQRDELRQQLESLSNELRQVQGDQPLMQPFVDAQAIAEVIANWTGIPVGKMIGDEITAVLNLKERLQQRVIGQEHALEAIAQAIRTSRAGLTDPRKPIGVFLMVGTSGVGKTETALALADLLFGGEQNLTVINMSEFKEEHKVSMLLGSPPGYVGYGEGGVLTEAARRKPYSVILLDEMEKAHPGVQDVFYNLFDKGTIKDGEGRDIDFKNTLIIMTSNAGEDAIRALCSGGERPDPAGLLEQIRPELLRHFKPAFLGRCSVISYYPLEDEDLKRICAINMKRIEKRVREHYGAGFEADSEVLDHVVARCREVETGARNIENILNRSLLPELAGHCLERLAQGLPIRHIRVGLGQEGEFTYSIE